jgi:DNA-binding NarL/FixJ family response regulator
VVVAHTYRLSRAALRSLLEAKGIVVVAEAATIDEAAALVLDTGADVLISEAVLGGASMVAALPSLRAASPRTRVVIVAPIDNPGLPARLLDAGATAVVLMEHSADALIEAIRTVHDGGRWIAPRSRRHGPGSQGDADDAEARKIRTLTRREHDIVRLVGEGLNNPQIAERLVISQATVRNHLTSILDKLDLSNCFELAVYSFRHGLVSYPRYVARTPVPLSAVSYAS